MDINRLLSPSDGGTPSQVANTDEASSSAHSSPRKVRPSLLASGKRTSSSLSQEITRSPGRSASSSSSRPGSGYGAPGLAHAAVFNAQQAALAAPNFRPQPPTSDPSPSAEAFQHHQPSQRPQIAHRPLSHPQVHNLTGAPAQHRQQTSRNSSEYFPPQQSPSGTPLTAPPAPVSRTISRQSLADITMAEAPSQTPPPRSFTSAALSGTDSQSITDLLNHLAANSYAYEQHVQLINLLHKGFLAHTYAPVDAPDDTLLGNPHTYALLNELRQAREAMDTRFAVGEDIWTDWLSDAMLLARTTEERIGVTELCQKAVQDEPSSVILWQAYTSWVLANYAACHNLEGADLRNWTAEDQEMCKELFTRSMILDVFEQAVAATQWRIDQSHVLWNHYARIVQEAFPISPSAADVDRLNNLFFQRFQVPHATLDETTQMFWPVAKLRGHDLDLMAYASQEAEPAKRQMALRAEHELKLQRAMQSGDRSAVQADFERYIKWEKKPKKVPHLEYQLRCALYERALLRFPTSTEWWLDYVDYAVSAAPADTASLLPLVERATRHCPWSGDLWARRILRADVEHKPRDDIEATKHRATNAGLLELGGLEELVKMLQQWCSYLRRHAFRHINSEDDLDTAEAGIAVALEDVQEAGKKLYGNEFNGDPLFRLEQVQIKFLTEGRRVEDARNIYRQVAKRLGNSFDMWSRYYNWELWLWGYDRMTEQHRVETTANGPDLATAVVQDALRQGNLDWPEKVLEMYLWHFQQHESGLKLHAALIEAREFSNKLAGKRTREAEEAANFAAQQQEQLVAAAQVAGDVLHAGEKRKREEGIATNGDASKKAKTGKEDVNMGGFAEPSESATAQIKRDREHNTITARNLPADVTELEIQKFFRDVGIPLSINILRGGEGKPASATVEFSNHEDMLAAKTRDGRSIGSREVHINSGGQNTLYVTNYPETWAESDIRELFQPHGDITSVRFPSLKFDSRRRFCYVTFLTTESAKAAETTLDGHKTDGERVLTAKISNPDAKKQRSGAQAERRELFVKNLDRQVTESEATEFFQQFGTVERVNLLKLVNNRKTGTAFVVVSTAEEAEKAVKDGHDKVFRGRNVQIEVSTPKGRADPMERAKKEDIIIRQGGATSASPGPEAAANGVRRDSDASMASSAAPTTNDSHATVRERKVAIFNLPDTVNDARVRVAMEAHGPITKIQLRRDKCGAIVEFADVKTAFKVKQGSGIDLSSLGPDAKPGDVGDLLKGAKVKANKSAAFETGDAAKPATGFVPSSVGRAGAGRGGRRGGLGFKRGGGGGVGSQKEAEGTTVPAKEPGKKSNDDFRSMFEASKTAEE